MPERERDTTHDTSQQLSDQTKGGAKRAAGMAGRGINKATRKTQKAAKEAAKKFLRKTGKKLAIAAGKIVSKLALIILKLIMTLLPYIIAALAIILVIWLISGWFVDDEYESKAEKDNYQIELITEDNETSYNTESKRYEVLDRSNGNKLFKMFYGYMAQRGYWKIEVDEDGKPKGDLMRGDEKKAQKMIDKYNREKEFIMNSDLLYLLDIELNATYHSQFFFPEQFIQPVYHDKNYNLKQLTDENGNLVVKSTKYDKKTKKPTDEKEVGVWDYGFGAILQYQKFKEQREKRAELRETYKWDYENKKLKTINLKPGEGKEIKEKVEGYPKTVYMIRKMTNAVGTIENEIIFDWKKTNEKWTKKEKIKIPAEKEEVYYETEQATNADGEPLYWLFDPVVVEPKFNEQTTDKTQWPVTIEVEKTRWVPTEIEVEQIYEGHVWEKVPQYDGEPNTDGIVGDKYFFDYLTHYEVYAPDVVMEKFDIEKRTRKDIEGLEEIWREQEQVENAGSVYDAAPEDYEGVNTLDLVAGIKGDSQAYKNALEYLDLFELYGKRYGVDPYLLLAKAAQESGGRHEENKKSSGGYGLMQIESPGRVITGVKALNFETGKVEHMVISGPGDVDSVEDNIRAGAMITASRLKDWNYNIAIGMQAYNFGTPAMNKVIEEYARRIGSTKEQVVANHGDTGWQEVVMDLHKNPQKYISNWPHKTYGDPNYLQNVMRYYSSPVGGTPWVIDENGDRHSMDGSIQVGAAIVGNGTGANKNWFASLIDALKGKWDELFNDSPVDALQNKDKYNWTYHSNRMTEDEFVDFMKMYRTFVDGVPYSEVKELWTPEDWKTKYQKLFENPRPDGVLDDEVLKEYEALMKLFPDGVVLPADKVSKISVPYNGEMLKLAIGQNTVIKSMINGKITKADVKDGVLEITQENGVKLVYTGLKNINVKKGDKVKQGDEVGRASKDLGVGIISSEGNSVDPTPIFAVMGDGTQKYNYAKVLALIESVEGYPYNMKHDANHPSSGYFDCSGLMQWAFGEVGIKLPRTAQSQYNVVMKIDKSQARPGDLIFFEGTYNSANPITHVGLYIGNGKFWNAQGKGVRVASLKNDPGDGNYWSNFRYHFGRIQ